MSNFDDNSQNFLESIVAAGIGVFFGFLAAALLSSSKKTVKCPVCNNTIDQGVETCPHCGVELRW